MIGLDDLGQTILLGDGQKALHDQLFSVKPWLVNWPN